MSRPVLSVVVIGRNEGARLVRCLESVQAMQKPRGGIEIIYVDSNSTDASRTTAAALGARVLSLGSAQSTAARARNLGWRAATADVILFLDGDTVLQKNFVSSSLKEFQDAKVAIVWGHRREIHPSRSVYNRVLDLDWIYPPGYSDFCGGDALVRRSVLEEVSGFDGNLIAGEEPEMCNRIRQKGYLILHVDQPMTGHDLDILSWQQYWRRAFRAGYAYAEVASRFRQTDHPLWDREVQHHFLRAGILAAIATLAITLSLVTKSPIPSLLLLGSACLLVVRTAHRSAWKSGDLITRCLYAVHSHFQHVPIAVGQASFTWDSIRSRRRGLIEYKG